TGEKVPTKRAGSRIVRTVPGRVDRDHTKARLRRRLHLLAAKAHPRREPGELDDGRSVAPERPELHLVASIAPAPRRQSRFMMLRAPRYRQGRPGMASLNGPAHGVPCPVDTTFRPAS